MHEFPKLMLDNPWLLISALLISILLSILLGKMLGSRLLHGKPDGDVPGVGLIEGGVFALLGLLVALTFSSAVTRFDARRALLVEEANAIGTAELRIDLLPADVQPGMREAFARYKQSRIDAYAQAENMPSFLAGLKRSNAIQTEIWAMSMQAGRRPDALPSANILMTPALNAMFDITTTRAMAMVTHTPKVVYIVMWISALIASFLAGNAMAKSRQISWIHSISFAFIMTLALYAMIDIEYPRIGFANLDSFVAVLKQIAG